ncbi:serine/threonine-protein kinase [Pendulispora albinea]|uniref:Serine/threonine protein kinase n=1 Tax=Pendulispora albinea TaxID=2741071 RepID=A0ABZ2M050_9BACT
MAQVDQNLLIGRKIAGKFAVEAFIGSGAMGAVYRARQVSLDKLVALKLLHRDLAKDSTFPARFMREAKAASRIDHPNSMRVIDFGEEDDGTLYMAMEFLDGRDLFQVIQSEWPLPPPRVADLVMQTLAALAVAHDMGVVHRDLKPENIMVLPSTDDEGQPKDVVKVCDFGIAKIIEERKEPTTDEREQGKLTTHGLVVGTPEYMSPEQGRGEALDARADIYSVGVILYQLLTGTVPFEANSALGVVLKHVTDEPLAPSQRAPGVDKKLEAICLKAMRKAREERYQSAREMRADLRAFLEGGPLASSAQSSAPPGAVARRPLVTPHDLGVAATEVSIDAAVVRAASARISTKLERTPSRLTPLGTDIDADLLPARGRWTGHLLAAGLLLGVAALGAFIFRGAFSQSTVTHDPSTNAASVVSSASSGASQAPSAEVKPVVPPPEPQASAAPPPPSHVSPPTLRKEPLPPPEDLVEQAPADPGGSAAPSTPTRPGGRKPKPPRTPIVPPPGGAAPPNHAPSAAPTWGVVPPTTPPIVQPSASPEVHPADPPAPAPSE